MLEVKELSKAFAEVNVLNNIDLNVDQGEFLVLVGPSGCGKSTLIRSIAGLEKPCSGKIIFDGNELQDLEAKDRAVSMVFQNYALYPHKTVFENIAFPLEISGYKKVEIKERVNKIASSLSIDSLLQRKPKELSGGQRQRVALARALIKEPKIFLLDEPLSNLDAKLRVQMRQELADLKKHSQACFVYVTHDQVEALSLGDKIAILHEGVLQQLGSPMNVYNDPANIFVATFIGTPPMNIIYGLENFEDYALGIRPENLSLDAIEDALEIETEISLIENLGSDYIVYLRLCGSKANLKDDSFLLARLEINEKANTLYKEFKDGKELFKNFYVARNLLYYFNKESGARIKRST